MCEFTQGQLATLACILEVSAPKPGNVHRGAEFADMSFEQMVCGAVAIGPAMDAAAGAGVGATVLAAVQATQSVARVNTNLGTILLMAPLAASDPNSTLQAGLPAVLDSLSSNDAANVYSAIQTANPGGMGSRAQYDVNEDPPDDLLAAMRLAEEDDLIAAQYARGYREFFELIVPALLANLQKIDSPRWAIVQTHVQLMACFPDSLIRRKRGAKLAEESAVRAQRVLESGKVGSSEHHSALADLDFWLRSDGNARNPGTTADFIAAALFAAMRDGLVDVALLSQPGS